MRTGRPAAILIVVGDEVLSGRVVDTNSSALARGIEAIGYRVTRKVAVGDGEGELAGVLRSIHQGVQLVVVAGGIGPTEDDRTRSEIAGALSVELLFREAEWHAIRAYLQSRGVEPSERNRRQAFFPSGATVITNRFGSAPAFRVRLSQGADCWVLPGVPWELEKLLETELLPALARERVNALPDEPARVLHFFAVPEAALDEWFMSMIPLARRADYHIYVRAGELEVRLPSELDLSAACAAQFGARFLGGGDVSLAERVVREAAALAKRVTTAESCTGGLLAARLTSVPGASQVFDAGWIVYSEAMKTQELSVPRATLREHGAVSLPVAVYLAREARRKSCAHLAVSITGVAGPGGGTPETPVGTLCMALASEAGVWARRVQVPGDREQVRSRGVGHALFALLLGVRGTELAGWEFAPV